MQGKLPKFMQFNSAVDLVRLGKKNDGGYLISASDIEASDTLIGLGINDDWSFEADFCSRNDVPVFAFDASIAKRKFLRKMLEALFHIYNPFIFIFIKATKTYFSYLIFFKGKHKHIEKFVGLNAAGKHCEIKSVFDVTTSSRLFLKIDIEGSEYRILDGLLENEGRINGMVIEFHDCDLHLEKIKTFIEKLKMPLVHVHANNYAPIRKDDDLPLVLELTFSKNAVLDNKNIMPHKLDMPNSKSSEEINLSFLP